MVSHIFLLSLLSCLNSALAAPQVTINSNQVVTGLDEGNGIESFKGIPYAQPPYGPLRFARPLAFNGSYDGLQATNFSASCIGLNSSIPDIYASVASQFNPITREMQPLINSMFNISTTTMDENCLFLNIYRPSGLTKDSNKPVMVWVHGGEFSRGGAVKYNGSHFVQASKNLNQEVLLVTFNYRLGSFGFLGGDAIKSEDSGNAGLLDQRLVLEWVQDHIADFGGDPDRVTIFGQGSGAGSILNHLVALDGDFTYRSKPVARAVILQSPTSLSLESITDNKPQRAFEKVAEVAGCGNRRTATEKLACLRLTSQWQISRAQLFVNGTNNGVAWAPRSDGSYLRDRPKLLLTEGKIAHIPFIVGNQQDEGTLQAYSYTDIVTDTDFRNLLSSLVYSISTPETKQAANLYPSDPSQGAPFGTGLQGQVTAQFKRVAAFLTDFKYQSGRRQFLQQTDDANVTRYNFLSTELEGLLPTLGTFHFNDLLWQWLEDSGPYKAYQDYFIAFANHLDPNNGTSLPHWPEYTSYNKETLQIGYNDFNVTSDDFREEQIEFLITHPELSSLG